MDSKRVKDGINMVASRATAALMSSARKAASSLHPRLARTPQVPAVSVDSSPDTQGSEEEVESTIVFSPNTSPKREEYEERVLPPVCVVLEFPSGRELKRLPGFILHDISVNPGANLETTFASLRVEIPTAYDRLASAMQLTDDEQESLRAIVANTVFNTLNPDNKSHETNFRFGSAHNPGTPIPFSDFIRKCQTGEILPAQRDGKQTYFAYVRPPVLVNDTIRQLLLAVHERSPNIYSRAVYGTPPRDHGSLKPAPTPTIAKTPTCGDLTGINTSVHSSAQSEQTQRVSNSSHASNIAHFQTQDAPPRSVHGSVGESNDQGTSLDQPRAELERNAQELQDLADWGNSTEDHSVEFESSDNLGTEPRGSTPFHTDLSSVPKAESTLPQRRDTTAPRLPSISEEIKEVVKEPPTKLGSQIGRKTHLVPPERKQNPYLQPSHALKTAQASNVSTRVKPPTKPQVITVHETEDDAFLSESTLTGPSPLRNLNNVSTQTSAVHPRRLDDSHVPPRLHDDRPFMHSATTLTIPNTRRGMRELYEAQPQLFEDIVDAGDVGKVAVTRLPSPRYANPPNSDPPRGSHFNRRSEDDAPRINPPRRDAFSAPPGNPGRRPWDSYDPDPDPSPPPSVVSIPPKLPKPPKPPTPHGGGSPPHSTGSAADTYGTTPIDGYDWREHRINPVDIEAEIVTDTHTIRPWRFLRRETGNIINHGTRFKIFVTSREVFLRNFGYRRLGEDGSDIKSFFYRFPSLPDNATPSQMLNWLGAVSHYCSGFGVYVPPPHTMTAQHPLGRWKDLLPPEYNADIAWHDNVLLQALLSKSTNLRGTKALHAFLTERLALQMIMRIAQKAGHPALTYGRATPPVPRQGSTDTITDYMEKWLHYLHIHYLHGTFYSDRYFLESFAGNLNNYYSRTLRPLLINIVRRYPVNDPVPPDLYPEFLVDYLSYIAPQCGALMDPTATPVELREKELAQRKPRSTKPVRSISVGNDDDGSISTIRSISTSATTRSAAIAQIESYNTLGEDDFSYVCQLITNPRPPRKCDLCLAEDHILYQCPRLKEFKDPTKARRMISIMHKTGEGMSTNTSSTASTSRSGTPPRSNVKSVHQLDQDDATMEGSAGGLETDDDTVGTVDTATDFH